MPTFAVVFFTLVICFFVNVFVEFSEQGADRADMAKVFIRLFWQLVAIMVFLAFRHSVPTV